MASIRSLQLVQRSDTGQLLVQRPDTDLPLCGTVWYIVVLYCDEDVMTKYISPPASHLTTVPPAAAARLSLLVWPLYTVEEVTPEEQYMIMMT